VAFKKFLAGLGVGGASVETVLSDPNVRPGGNVQGEVRLQGGQVDQELIGVKVGLVARVEVESGDSEYSTDMEFHRLQVGGRGMLRAGETAKLPFSLDIPWETPISAVAGHHLRGMAIGVRTELEIAKGLDKGDLDPLVVHPLPAQQLLLDAFLKLGFRFSRADLERGHVPRSRQSLPFYQEIEYYPAPQYARGMNQLEVTFVAGPTEMDVILEVDKRGGLLTEGHDAFGSFVVQYATAEQVNWPERLHGWLDEASRRRGFF
jgi:sporulation-control protein